MCENCGSGTMNAFSGSLPLVNEGFHTARDSLLDFPYSEEDIQETFWRCKCYSCAFLRNCSLLCRSSNTEKELWGQLLLWLSLLSHHCWIIKERILFQGCIGCGHIFPLSIHGPSRKNHISVFSLSSKCPQPSSSQMSNSPYCTQSWHCTLIHSPWSDHRSFRWCSSARGIRNRKSRYRCIPSAPGSRFFQAHISHPNSNWSSNYSPHLTRMSRRCPVHLLSKR